jgi:hypothetical protein
LWPDFIILCSTDIFTMKLSNVSRTTVLITLIAVNTVSAGPAAYGICQTGE